MNNPHTYRHPGTFVLEQGGSIEGLEIAYHIYGKPDAKCSNVVWVCHALTANSEVADWWPHTVETGGFLDPEKYCIVCANILGSCYGTTGPLSVNPSTGHCYYEDFPAVTIADMVRAHSYWPIIWALAAYTHLWAVVSVGFRLSNGPFRNLCALAHLRS